MKKKVYICKSRENEKDYFVFEDMSFIDINDEWFDAYKVIWGDFERANCAEIEGMTFDEMEKAFYEFEQEWVELKPNFGLSIDRMYPTMLLV